MGSDAAAGGARADWVTCLRLLERAAAADVARDGAALTAASSTHVGWGCLFWNKKSKKNVFAMAA